MVAGYLLVLAGVGASASSPRRTRGTPRCTSRPRPRLSRGAAAARRARSGPVLFARYAYSPNRLGPVRAGRRRGAVRRGDDRRRRPRAPTAGAGVRGRLPVPRADRPRQRHPGPARRRAWSTPTGSAARCSTGSRRGCSPTRCGRGSGRGSGPPTWRWLEGAAPTGGKPVHAFHVLDVFPKVGLMRGEQADKRRRGHGLVPGAMGPGAGADRRPAGGERRPAATGRRRARAGAGRGPPRHRVAGGAGFIGEVAVGDVVSVHWDWACDVLDDGALDAAGGVDPGPARGREPVALSARPFHTPSRSSSNDPRRQASGRSRRSRRASSHSAPKAGSSPTGSDGLAPYRARTSHRNAA